MKKLSIISASVLVLLCVLIFAHIKLSQSTLLIYVPPSSDAAIVMIDGVEVGRIEGDPTDGAIKMFSIAPGRRVIEIKVKEHLVLREELDVSEESSEYYLAVDRKQLP